MSHAFYDNLAGLRTWRSSELRQRRRIADQLVETAETTLAEINPAWRFEEVEAPTMMPVERMSSAYTSDDIFLLQDAPGGSKQWAMRAETTDGSYLAAVELLRNTNLKAPLAVWQMGKSYRRETNDGATAAKLRFNEFTQLEMQCVYRADTSKNFVPEVRDALRAMVEAITRLETRLIESDRLPSYSTETIDIECLTPEGEWREVASTSRRTDFPTPNGHVPLIVFEIAFGMDRMIALTNRKL